MPSAGSASASDVSVVCGPCTSWWCVLMALSITSSTAWTSSVPDETTTRRSVSAIRFTNVWSATSRGYSAKTAEDVGSSTCGSSAIGPSVRSIFISLLTRKMVSR